MVPGDGRAWGDPTVRAAADVTGCASTGAARDRGYSFGTGDGAAGVVKAAAGAGGATEGRMRCGSSGGRGGRSAAGGRAPELRVS